MHGWLYVMLRFIVVYFYIKFHCVPYVVLEITLICALASQALGLQMCVPRLAVSIYVYTPCLTLFFLL